jgi:hypothetical protein
MHEALLGELDRRDLHLQASIETPFLLVLLMYAAAMALYNSYAIVSLLRPASAR